MTMSNQPIRAILAGVFLCSGLAAPWRARGQSPRPESAPVATDADRARAALETLEADLQARLRLLRDEFRGRQQAIRARPADAPQDTIRRLRQLQRELRVETARLAREHRRRRRLLREDARRRDPYGRSDLRALGAQLSESERELRDELSFRRLALLRELQGQSLTQGEKDREIGYLESEYKRRELRLREDYWNRRAETTSARGLP